MTRSIDIEALCAEKGLRITEHAVIARVLGRSRTIPTLILHARAAVDPESRSPRSPHRPPVREAGILERHDFGDGRARYEAAAEGHHDHLIDVETGNVIKFVDEELNCFSAASPKLGFRLVDHRMSCTASRSREN